MLRSCFNSVRLKKFDFRQIYIYLKSNWISLLLVFIALWDIRFEIRLLIENFTFIGLFFAIYNHPLAILVLIFIPKIGNNNTN